MRGVGAVGIVELREGVAQQPGSRPNRAGRPLSVAMAASMLRRVFRFSWMPPAALGADAGQGLGRRLLRRRRIGGREVAAVIDNAEAVADLTQLRGFGARCADYLNAQAAR
jgi:hypothetical protein